MRERLFEPDIARSKPGVPAAGTAERLACALCDRLAYVPLAARRAGPVAPRLAHAPCRCACGRRRARRRSSSALRRRSMRAVRRGEPRRTPTRLPVDGHAGRPRRSPRGCLSRIVKPRLPTQRLRSAAGAVAAGFRSGQASLVSRSDVEAAGAVGVPDLTALGDERRAATSPSWPARRSPGRRSARSCRAARRSTRSPSGARGRGCRRPAAPTGSSSRP